MDRPDTSDKRLRIAELEDEDVDGRELGGLECVVEGAATSVSASDVNARGGGTDETEGPEAILEISAFGLGEDSRQSITTVPVCQLLK